MDEEQLIYQTKMTFQDETFQILVYCRKDGHHIAKTPFNPTDIIINDGITLEDVLEKHRNLLPLAITSRKMLNTV